MSEISQSVQPVFEEMTRAKKNKNSVKRAINDALKSDKTYQGLLEEKKAVDARLKAARQSVMEDMSKDVRAMEDFADEERSVKVAVENAVVKEILRGETVRVTDGRKTLVLRPTYRAEKEQ